MHRVKSCALQNVLRLSEREVSLSSTAAAFNGRRIRNLPLLLPRLEKLFRGIAEYYRCFQPEESERGDTVRRRKVVTQ